MENGIKGFGAISRDGDPYDFYIDKWVEILTQNETCWGVYRGMKAGYLTLRPYLRAESFPSSKEDKREKIIMLADEPKIIANNSVNTVGGIREEHALAVISHREIIIP